MIRNRPQLVLVAGTKDSGKTTYLDQCCKMMRGKGNTVGGLLSLASWQNGQKYFYEIQNIDNGQKRILASQEPCTSFSLQYGPYFFDPISFNWGNEILCSSIDKDVIIFDEFGPIESKGGGFFPAFEFLVKRFTGIFYVSVRTSLIIKVKELVNDISTDTCLDIKQINVSGET